MALLVDMYLERNNANLGYGMYQDTVNFVEKMSAEDRAKLTTSARDAVSRAAFRLADRIYDDFERVSLNAKTEQAIRAAVEKKLDMGNKAAQAFDPVIRVYARPGWMIAPWTRSGQCLTASFGNSIDPL